MSQVKRKRNWKTLEWKKGPLFPAKHQLLPKTIKLNYKKLAISLSPKAEEAAVIYVRYIDKFGKNKIFNNNFFQSWRDEWMNNADRDKIKELKYCDFKAIKRYVERQKRNKISPVLKKRRDIKKKEHCICIVDGKEQKICNFTIEPPGIYIGRGNNPHLGKLKKRVQHKDITLNCTKAPTQKENWKVVTQPWNAWVAKYRNIDFHERSQHKFIFLSNDSPIQTKKDKQKYDQARELGKVIKKIRKDYAKDLKSSDDWTKQMGVALYLIDKLSIRVGHEKGADETHTVGCCTLERNNITFKQNNNIHLKFDGKDSITFNRTIDVPKDVYTVLKWCKRQNSSDGKLFNIKAEDINNRLKRYMEGLSAKVFRTYSASLLLEQHLKRAGNSQNDKIIVFNEANIKVAKLCNHQTANGRAYQTKLKNLAIKIAEKKRKIKTAIRKIRKTRLLEEQLKKLERTARLVKLMGPHALDTSKANYLDPRVVVAWCKKNTIQPHQIYSKKLLSKFKWAMETSKNYTFSKKG